MRRRGGGRHRRADLAADDVRPALRATSHRRRHLRATCHLEAVRRRVLLATGECDPAMRAIAAAWIETAMGLRANDP